MSVPNFSFLACLEVAEKFGVVVGGVVWGGLAVATAGFSASLFVGPLTGPRAK